MAVVASVALLLNRLATDQPIAGRLSDTLGKQVKVLAEQLSAMERLTDNPGPPFDA